MSARTLKETLTLSAAMLTLTAGAAQAQTAPSQTPPGATAVEASPESRFSFPPAQGLTAPAGADDVHFALSDIIVEGQFAALERTSDMLEAARTGREASVAEIYVFAAELQQAYFAAGYPLARVVVPPQELGSDGRVRVLVVDGFVESVDTSQLPREARARVAQVLAPLVDARQPTRAEIERRLLLAGDTAGLTLTSTLTPGARTGATVLVLSGEHDVFAGVVAFDNRVSEQLGDTQITASFVANSPFGHGERFYATFAGAPDGGMFSEDSMRRYVALGASMPLGIDGLTLSFSADYSSTRPGADVAAQKLHSEYARLGAGLSYPIVRSRAANLVARAQFDATSDVQRTEIGGYPGVTLSADRLRVIRLGVFGDAALTGAGGRVEYGVGVSAGIDGLGARSAADATPLKPLTRQGADASFTALDAQVRLSTPTPFGANVSFAARGRYSFEDPLLRSEQFSPSGWDGLSGPPPGLMIGDEGAVARFEIERPFGNQDQMIAPYAFAAGATVELMRPTALERRHTAAESAGVGLRFGLGQRAQGSGYAITAAIEMSTVRSRDSELDGAWTTAAIGIRF